MQCGSCKTSVRITQFRPVLDAAALDVGEGRCLNHPGKDALDACGRCGGYVCDVCVTRTGERVLCPACFDLLHERGELDTTRRRRVRWDRMSLPAVILGGAVCGPLGVVGLGVAIYALWRRRKEPWLSPWPPIVTIVLCVVPFVMLGVVMLFAGDID